MGIDSATAQASPNIAFIKYWGNRDEALRIPENGSISMNLKELQTRTQVTFDPHLGEDRLVLDGKPISGIGLERVSSLLTRVRKLAGLKTFAVVTSKNNFPSGAGLASSASGFASLSLAASAAIGLSLSESELSRLARLGSGSACRSIPGGYVEWQPGDADENSYAISIIGPDHWDLVDCITIVSQAHKAVSSSAGHALAKTSPLQQARVADAPRRLEICRKAILARDFEALAEIVELDSNLMHSIMLTSTPPLIYWRPETIAVMQRVVKLRQSGIPVCYTVDAGPNVHAICRSDFANEVLNQLRNIPGVQEVMVAHPGGAAQLVS